MPTDPLADLADDIAAAIAAVHGAEITVGIQAEEGAQAHGDTTTLDVAVWNHYGTRRIPARPWLDAAEQQHGASWLDAWAWAVGEVAETGDPGLYLMRVRQLAVVAVADCQQAMVDLRDPPNAEETVLRKGSDNPLIDTAQLLRSHRARLAVAGHSEVVG